MNSLPPWLPPLEDVNPWTSETFDRLYDIFIKDFKLKPARYCGKNVWHFPEMDNGKERVFWHLTHEDDKITGDRLPDLRRCERLPWVKVIIENSHQPEVLNWDFLEGDGSVKTYFWLKDHDFLVILKKYPKGEYRIITSFYIKYNHKRRELEKKYTKRI